MAVRAMGRLDDVEWPVVPLYDGYTFKGVITHGIERHYYANGQIHSETPWVNGQTHGTARTWYKNGSLSGESVWVNDRENSIKKWYVDGKPKFEGYFESESIWKEICWHKNGQIEKEGFWFDNFTYGIQKHWSKTGRPYRNEYYINEEKVSKREWKACWLTLKLAGIPYTFPAALSGFIL